MYRHLVNEIAALHLIIIGDLALVISGPLSSVCRSGTSTDHLYMYYTSRKPPVWRLWYS